MLIWNQPNLETYTSVVLLHKYCVDTITIAKLIWSYPNQKLNEKVSSVSYFRTEMLSSGLATQPYIGLLRRGIREAQNNIQETDTVVCIQSEYIDKRCPRGKGVRIFFFTSAMQTDQKKKKLQRKLLITFYYYFIRSVLAYGSLICQLLDSGQEGPSEGYRCCLENNQLLTWWTFKILAVTAEQKRTKHSMHLVYHLFDLLATG